MNAPATVPSLRRADPRSEVSGQEVHGIVSYSQGHEQAPFILWDISDQGLRLWTPVRLKPSDVVRLTVVKPNVLILSADVRWCRAVGGGDEGFYVGLHVLDNQRRLEALHKSMLEAKTAGPMSPT